MSRIEDRENFFKEHLGLTSDELWEDWENYRDGFYAAEKAAKNAGGRAVADAQEPEHKDLLDNKFKPFREPPCFGSDLPWEKGEVLTDNRGDCLREDERRKGWCDERERSDGVSDPSTRPCAAGVKMYVDTVEGCADGLVIKFRRHAGYYKYKGLKRLEDVKSLTFREGFVPDSEHLTISDDDIVLIDGTSLGHGDNSGAWGGVYAIRLPSDGKWKVAQHGDLFPSLRRDLSNADSLNFRAGVKLRGVSGTVISISPHIEDETERKERKRSFVARMREKGIVLYNNERTVSDGSEPVGTYTALGGFRYRIGKSGEWKEIDSSDIIGDVCRIYGSEGGCSDGMYVIIR
ncbi:MAG: hypothetical protein IKH15_08030 [Bacteroidales bacterium]|nr:hypothetical protein [Bacteroidales bacterium]MBR4637032.1 hypothetical protein [Bacteroidales bacterium]